MQKLLVKKEQPSMVTRASAKRDQGWNRSTALLPDLWYDTRGIANAFDADSVFSRAAREHYSGVLVDAAQLDKVASPQFDRLLKVVAVSNSEDIAAVKKLGGAKSESYVIMHQDAEMLAQAKKAKLRNCRDINVVDRATLEASCQNSAGTDFLSVSFKDPTNIPLELVVAESQDSPLVVLKHIPDPDNIDDALNSLCVMEFGVEGLVYSPRSHAVLDRLNAWLTERQRSELKLEAATVESSVPVGMGIRSCIDVATLFTDREGMLIGLTSSGGIMSCPEVFDLPYMDLRPFRVNAGSTASYVYGMNNRTNYMSELRAGSQAMIVGHDGKVYKAPISRMKTERRPLRLITARFDSGVEVSVMMQDDWHVRLYSADGSPRNLTEIAVGEKLMAYQAQPGRHVGVPVNEFIEER
ncbi:3-amino-4-hydroxybenzoic acid synthase [Pseudovibrio axinellae]|uniref:3-amino-4-hydroxybenzoic acid synthase n=1 Tax=Pseudovibrio axinellae TaxID=989403 RepID=A0A165U0M8_9HYPH|nr:3-dehydroquinate synthase II [Pseudovibrio axinellae]KZL09097.1 3-amino-4-hydroxybenzoic acid synthase [Pseudovibrio axinellae]SER75247.1 3-dehydroquinate synthase II [Pseudovibrio axinellae]